MLRISTGWCMRHAKSAVLLTNSALGKAAVLAARFPRATPFTIRPSFRALPLLLSLALFIGGCSALSSTGAFLDAPQLKIDPTLLVATTRNPIDGARAMEANQVLKAAAKPIDAPRHHHVELALCGVPAERIKRRALIPSLGTANAVILVNLDDLAAHAAGNLAQLALLVGRSLLYGRYPEI